MKNILSVLVENKAGVLSHTAGLFARRGFNIDSLAVGETDDPAVSRMTIVVEEDEWVVEQVVKQLNKRIDVIKIKELDAEKTTRRELALIKVRADTKTRSEITEIASIMKTQVVDLSATTLTIEICDRPEKVKVLIELLQPYGILELARTGMVALQKGDGGITAQNGYGANPA